MRLVVVNHCHPDTPHVCAARLRDFARAAARAGHQVVLLTETLEGGPADFAPCDVPARLTAHDWAEPLSIACPPVPGRLVARLREGRVPRVLRRPLLAAQYLARAGLFTDWRDGARPYVAQLARHFRPQAAWASFGNTDAWAIARLLRCPWVGDVKDPWGVFIPPPLRRLLAARFRDAHGYTALSDQHGADWQHWSGRGATTVYSGIDDGFLTAPPPPPPGPPRLLVLGALYGGDHLAALLDGVRHWDGGATLVYAGAEAVRFREAARGFAVETPGYVELPRLRALAAGCHALLYVRNPAALYQHKLVELLALDRPILCLPEEAPESLGIARALGGAFRSCNDAGAVAEGLAALVGRPVAIDRGKLADYTWDAQARRLLAVLEGAA